MLAAYEKPEVFYQVGWSHGKEMLSKDRPDTGKGSCDRSPQPWMEDRLKASEVVYVAPCGSKRLCKSAMMHRTLYYSSNYLFAIAPAFAYDGRDGLQVLRQPLRGQPGGSHVRRGPLPGRDGRGVAGLLRPEHLARRGARSLFFVGGLRLSLEKCSRHIGTLRVVFSTQMHA